MDKLIHIVEVEQSRVLELKEGITIAQELNLEKFQQFQAKADECYGKHDKEDNIVMYIVSIGHKVLKNAQYLGIRKLVFKLIDIAAEDPKQALEIKAYMSVLYPSFIKYAPQIKFIDE